MQLVVFDLDGTLLNSQSQLSEFTLHTLATLQQKGIAYTIATGRSFSSAKKLIAGGEFTLPHIYSNGVLTWYPDAQEITLNNGLEIEDTTRIVKAIAGEEISPFISAVSAKGEHCIFHTGMRNDAEAEILQRFSARDDVVVSAIDDMPSDARVTNISMIGDEHYVKQAHHHLNSQSHLIAYSGPSVESKEVQWMDIHHRDANKGHAVETLRGQLGVTEVICFGDGDNDLSMFAVAEESYAMANAIDVVKKAANHVIGHNDEDGVAHFLHERFNL